MNNIQSEEYNLLQFISKLQEFYCLDDYENFTIISNSINDMLNYDFQQMNYSKYISVTFYIQGREKQLIKEINNLKRIYLFIRIYYKERFINILINRNEIISPKQLLDKINNIIYMKTAIKLNLGIKEFPLVKYFLQESQKIDQNFDKVFFLVDIIDVNNYFPNYNNPINNKIMIDNQNFNNFQNNNFNNNYNQNYSNKLNNDPQFLKDEKIKELEKLLNEEKNKNKELNLKINDLELMLKEALNKNTELNKKIQNLEEQLNKKDTTPINNLNNEENLTEIIKKNNIEINELKAKLSRYPFDLLEGEKMISIIFNSGKQDLNYSIICKNTDIFVNIELKLYKEYPKYSEVENFFTTNGVRINKYKSLEVNKIKDNSVILLQPIE